MFFRKSRPKGPDLSVPMLSLIQRLSLAPQGQASRIIAFIAARPREGTSTVARNYALSLAASANKTVLLLDAGPLAPKRYLSRGINPTVGMVDMVSDGKSALDAVHPIGERVSQGRWFSSDDMRGMASQLVHDAAFWQKLTKAFDAVIIDAPSLQYSYDGVMLAAKADATVIIVEAERTPGPVIKNLQDTLAAAGGKVTGAVMNKRRYYIPSRVYRKL